MHDLIIRNARIVDGTGAPAFAGSLVVDGDTITAVHRGGFVPVSGVRSAAMTFFLPRGRVGSAHA